MIGHTRALMQLIVVELLAIFLTASPAANIIALRGFAGCPPDEVPFGLMQAAFLALGLLCLAWVLRGIFQPRLLPIQFFNSLTMGVGGFNLTVPTGRAGMIYWPSTHPSYVAAEATFFIYLVIPAIAIGRDSHAIACGQQWSFAFAWLLVGLALLLPALRLLAWYVLRLRLPPGDYSKIHRGLYFPLGIGLPVALVLFGWVYLPPLLAPVLSSANFAGGLPANPQRAGRNLHVEGILIAGPIACACARSNPKACQSAVALIDLGPGGEVVVRGASDYARDVQRLADRPAGRNVRLYGELLAKPPRDYKSAAETCPADPFPPTPGKPRAWLEVEGL